MLTLLAGANIVDFGRFSKLLSFSGKISHPEAQGHAYQEDQYRSVTLMRVMDIYGSLAAEDIVMATRVPIDIQSENLGKTLLLKVSVSFLFDFKRHNDTPCLPKYKTYVCSPLQYFRPLW